MQRMTSAIAGLACFLAGAATGQENGRVVKLQAEVDALEAAIDAYRTASGAVAPAEFERSAELHALVSDVLADADQRAAFARGGTTAGYLDGFVLTSADGNFLLRLNGLVQTRYLLNSIDAPSGADGTRAGFDVKRTELVFSGNLFGPELQYEIVVDQTTDGTLVTDLSSLDPNDAAALGRLGVPRRHDRTRSELAAALPGVDGALIRGMGDARRTVLHGVPSREHARVSR